MTTIRKTAMNKMKKTYITPECETMRLVTQGLLAASLTISDDAADKISDESEYLSNKGGWSAADWSGAEY